MVHETPFVRILGSSDWLPTKENDGSCYLVSDRIMVDAGWSVAYNMVCHDLDPLMPKLLCLTHMHADHCMGLAQLILYWWIKRGSMEEWTIAGPRQFVKAAFDRAFKYVFRRSPSPESGASKLPEILELQDGDCLEAQGYQIRVIASDHTVPGLCYRFTHLASGHSAGFTGDTQYREQFGEFFRGCDLLLHETSFGAGPLDPSINAGCKHSSALEAAQVAREARVKQLLLTHAHETKRKASVETAQALLDIPVGWAIPFSVITF